MKRSHPFWRIMNSFIVPLCLCASVSLLTADISFAGVDMKSKMKEIAAAIVTNPAGFFYDFQQNIETTTPLPPGKTFGLQTGLAPSCLPMGYGNVSAKYRLHPEGGIKPGIPQLDIVAGCWDMIWVKIIQSDSINNAAFNGSYAGIIMSTSVSSRVRTFWGYKRSGIKIKLNLKEAVDLMGSQLTDIDSTLDNNFFIAGIEHSKRLNKLWSIQLNYSQKEKIIAAKVSWYGKYFESGLNIYPEGVLVIHPVCSFHLNF